MASGGGYSGPLAYRQGKGDAPRRRGGVRPHGRGRAPPTALTLIVNSAFRSDAEQAALFAANPDPTWVAPPGQSLHRCATELDLGPPSAYGWLAANAGRFDFIERYSWEPWHYGYDGGPPPCSEAGDEVGMAAKGDGEEAQSSGLQSFVPAQYRAPIVAAAARWNVSAGLLAAQLMAESGFDPDAVSPAGAQGIAQFMPATAATYGLTDPFDAEAAIDAQAHLMSDLLRRVRRLGPARAGRLQRRSRRRRGLRLRSRPIPETQAYVARILGLLDGVGEPVAPESRCGWLPDGATM